MEYLLTQWNICHNEMEVAVKSLDLSLEQIQKIAGDLCINPIHFNGSLVGFSVKPSNNNGKCFCHNFCRAIEYDGAGIEIERNKLVIQCGEDRRIFKLFPEEVSLVDSETKKNGIRYIFGISKQNFDVFFGKL